MAVDESSISEISYSIRKFSTLVANAAKEQFEKEMRLHMTDSEIIIRRRIDDALWEFHKKHHDVVLKIQSPYQNYLALQGYSQSDVLKIKMMDEHYVIESIIRYPDLFEDWYGPNKLQSMLERMYNDLKGD